jgi:hypothetical protein
MLDNANFFLHKFLSVTVLFLPPVYSLLYEHLPVVEIHCIMFLFTTILLFFRGFVKVGFLIFEEELTVALIYGEGTEKHVILSCARTSI